MNRAHTVATEIQFGLVFAEHFRQARPEAVVAMFASNVMLPATLMQRIVHFIHLLLSFCNFTLVFNLKHRKLDDNYYNLLDLTQAGQIVTFGHTAKFPQTPWLFSPVLTFDTVGGIS